MSNNMRPTMPTRQLSNSTVSSNSTVNDSNSDNSSLPTTPDFNEVLAKHHLTERGLIELYSFLVGLAKEGGKVMLEAEHAFLVAAATKNNTSDLVTQYDGQIERMLEQRMKAEYPNFDFLGEETFKQGTTLANTPTFVCDPIDGTLNFSKGVTSSRSSQSQHQCHLFDHVWWP
jgi:myo-inositol-1(or 4)-monophosphatase